MNFLKLFTCYVDALSEFVGRWVSYTMLILIVTSIYEIVSRYFFNRPTIWAYEFGQMLFGSYFLLVGAMALKRKEHVGMDMLMDKLSPRGQAILNSVTSMFTFLFLGVMVWKGGEFAAQSIRSLEHSTSVWGPPIYIYKAILPCASFLLLLQALSNFVKDIVFAITGKPLTGEA